MNNKTGGKRMEQGNMDYADTRPRLSGRGASAGGLEALQQFLGSMTNTTDLSFVIVQHLSPDYKSLLAEILGKHTSMTVIQAENKMEVMPGVVYLIPPKNNMVLRENKLYLTEYVHGGINHPIDVFFSSLAEEMKERAVAVVLSGTGSDGTSGVKAVKEHEGLVFVQDPASAKFDGMPKSAINTGLVDFVLTPQGIAAELANVYSYPVAIRLQDGSMDTVSEEHLLSRVYAVLKKQCGIDFTHYKRSTVIRRIERRMVVTHKEAFVDYVTSLEEQLDEAQALGREILIGVTSFFRDPAYFEKLKNKAIMDIVTRSGEKDAIRCWVAGCSTGEEAYSIAILFKEMLEECQVRRDVKIFATDVDARAIETAGRGLYSESLLDDVAPERLSRFFLKKGDQYQISKDIRKMIIFAPQNVFQDPPFGKLDLVSCRNVLIYFQPVLQKNLFAIFHAALRDNGYLFLGKSETAGDFADIFHSVCSMEKIYIHKQSGKAPEIFPVSYCTSPQRIVHHDAADGVREESRYEIPEESLYQQFLEGYLPPSIVVNERNDVLHFFGEYMQFLRIGRGRASLNVYDLVQDDLSLVLSTALNKCRETKHSVTYTDVSLNLATGGKNLVDILVEPIPDKRGNPTTLVAIIFSTRKHLEPVGEVERYDIDKTAAQRIINLENELQVSQASLQVTIGELETVNEELQAANEELLTANEELQSSNEELQSVNEELYTVNTEFQQKLDELTVVTNDMNNFLSTTMIGVLFIDLEMNMRKFTDYISREFHLMAHDEGRSIQILGHSFSNYDIAADASAVLKQLIPSDKEVISNDGKHYTIRIAPYRTTDNTIKGLVITIIDSLG